MSFIGPHILSFQNSPGSDLTNGRSMFHTDIRDWVYMIFGALLAGDFSTLITVHAGAHHYIYDPLKNDSWIQLFGSFIYKPQLFAYSDLKMNFHM